MVRKRDCKTVCKNVVKRLFHDLDENSLTSFRTEVRAHEKGGVEPLYMQKENSPTSFRVRTSCASEKVSVHGGSS